MPGIGVDIFEDHLDIPELESGFINQYDIEGNISMIQAFIRKRNTLPLFRPMDGGDDAGAWYEKK